MCDICHGINSHLCPVCGDSPTYKTCDKCSGEGWLYYAFNFVTNQSIRVKPEEYDELFDDEKAARSRGCQLCKGEIEKCPDCEGEGEVEDISDPEDYFDEDAAMERYYERKYGHED